MTLNNSNVKCIQTQTQRFWQWIVVIYSRGHRHTGKTFKQQIDIETRDDTIIECQVNKYDNLMFAKRHYPFVLSHSQ